MAEKTEIPILVIPANYFARYGHHLSQGLNKIDAWEATEIELQQQTGCRLYLNYESFRVGFNGHCNKRLKVKVILTIIRF